MRCISIRWLFVGLVFLFLCSHASAGIRPSFNPESSSWMATDIVVVTEGKKIDGIFRVVEVWKGELHSGETIQVPELASFLPEKSRVVQKAFYEKPPDKTLIVSGDRMVLFLKRESNALSTSSAD